MSRYRPLPCAGIGLGDSPVCAGCLRLSPGIGGRVLQIRPDVRDGACSDFIAGRRPNAPVRVTQAPMHAAIDSEDLPWFGMDEGREP